MCAVMPTSFQKKVSSRHMCFGPCSFAVRLLGEFRDEQSSVRPVNFSKEMDRSLVPEARNVPRVEYSVFIKLVEASSRKDRRCPLLGRFGRVSHHASFVFLRRPR